MMRGFSLVGGGARSGKSAFALRLALSRGKRRAFVATGIAFDDEMRKRIDRHIEERGGAFETFEAPHDLERVVARLAGAPQDPLDVIVVDCLTLWLSNLLLEGVTASAIEHRVDAFATTIAHAPFHCVVVTNEVGMGIVPETPLGRAFRDVAGRAHQRLARTADELYFAAMGAVMRLKPGPVTLCDHGVAP